MDARRLPSGAAFGADLNKADIVEYLKAFTLALDRDADGVVTVAALQEFYQSIGENLDADGAKQLIRDLQLRCGCLTEVRPGVCLSSRREGNVVSHPVGILVGLFVSSVGAGYPSRPHRISSLT